MSNLYGKSPSRVCARCAGYLFERTMQPRTLLILLILSFGCVFTAQAQFYAGVLGGISTLSGDARSLLSPSSSAFASYNPKNGGAVQVLVGSHFSDYFTLQANYIWSRNPLTLTAAAFNNGIQDGYQETRNSTQQSVVADVLVYFRKRDSRLRPYLSVGTGVVHFASSQERLDQVLGSPDLPPQRFSSNMIALH